jgi:hypothetical protein
MAREPGKIQVTLTLTIEHIAGPYRAEDWEQTALHSIEETLLNLDALWVPYDGPVEQTEYQITAVEVDDVFGTASDG